MSQLALPTSQTHQPESSTVTNLSFISATRSSAVVIFKGTVRVAVLPLRDCTVGVVQLYCGDLYFCSYDRSSSIFRLSAALSRESEQTNLFAFSTSWSRKTAVRKPSTAAEGLALPWLPIFLIKKYAVVPPPPQSRSTTPSTIEVISSPRRLRGGSGVG